MTIDPVERLSFSSTEPIFTPPAKRSGSISTTAACSPNSSRRPILRAYYYTALVEDQEYSSIRPLIDWLDYNGFTVVTKPARNSPTAPDAARSRAAWTSS